jgi:hypothetical protein
MPTVADIDPTAAMLDHLALAEAVSHGTITVIPLLTDKDDEPAWLTRLELGESVTIDDGDRSRHEAASRQAHDAAGRVTTIIAGD